MPEIQGLPASYFATPEPTESGDSDELGRDAFLKLLTTQLQNQNPLEPMSNEQFVAQLAQLSGVEELVGIRTALDSVMLGISALNDSSMASLLGTTVTAFGDTFEYSGEGTVELGYSADTAAASAEVLVYNEAGTVVDTIDLGAIDDGTGTFTWDGRGSSGDQLPEGTYTFEVRSTDSEGNPVGVRSLITGVVTEMDYSTGVPRPSINGTPVELSDIFRLQA